MSSFNACSSGNLPRPALESACTSPTIATALLPSVPSRDGDLGDLVNQRIVDEMSVDHVF
jgi:hypothetical protein